MMPLTDHRPWHGHFPSPLAFGLASLLGLSACAPPAAQAPAPKTAPPPPALASVGPAAPAQTADQPPSKTTTPVPAPIELSFTKSLEGVTTIEQALDKVKSALATQGFGIITKIDVQAVMKTKLGVEMRPFWILGACNPKKAHQAIEIDPKMGLLLPCKVIVYQSPDGAFIVAFARPKAIFSLMSHPGLSSLADDVEATMRTAFDAL